VLFRSMPSVRQSHCEHRVTRLKQGEVCSHIGLGATVRLDVGVFGSKELLGSVNSQLFDDVDVLAPRIVSLRGITLSVLVCEHRSLSLEDGRRRVILCGNEIDVRALPQDLAPNDVRHGRIDIVQ